VIFFKENTMQWEYFVHTINTGGVFVQGNYSGEEVTRMLNWYAAQGWEFVSNFAAAWSNGGTHAISFIFRREKQAGAAQPTAAPSNG
jgi:hypothetical protein